MAMGLAELYLSSPAILTSRIHGLPKEYEKSRRCCLQTPSLKIRSFSSQDLHSKVATPITISSRRGWRSKCPPGLLRAGHVHDDLVADHRTEVLGTYDIVTGESNDNTTLEVYGTNLTKLAEQGKLYLAGKLSRAEREKLVYLIVEFLCYQSSPVLIGGYRVGKTSIVEGLAQCIASGVVPDAMKGKQVIKLDMSLLLAGTKHQLEERLKKLIVEIKQSDKIILFINEVNFLSGAGGSKGAVAAANILKSAISRGELKWFIGAMTFDEYKNHFHKDPIFKRRFKMISIGRPSVDDTIGILKGLQVQQENRHQVSYTMEALFSAAQLYYRHMNDCFIPDESIFSIDQADSHVSVRNPQLLKEAQEEARDLLKELWQITKSKNVAMCSEDIKKVHKRELGLWLDIAHIICNKAKMGLGLSMSDVEAIVTKWTGIPIHKYSLEFMIRNLKRLGLRKNKPGEVIRSIHPKELIKFGVKYVVAIFLGLMLGLVLVYLIKRKFVEFVVASFASVMLGLLLVYLFKRK